MLSGMSMENHLMVEVGSGLNLLMEMTVEVIEIEEEVGIDVEIGTEIHVEVVEDKFLMENTEEPTIAW